MNQRQIIKEHHAIDLAEASRLWKEGASAALIGARFGISRNAVLGYAHRNREYFPPHVKKTVTVLASNKYAETSFYKPRKKASPEELERRKTERLERKALTDRARMEAVANDVREFQAGTSRYLRPHPDDAARQVRGKLLADLQSHECKFAVNSGGPFLFCAEATDGGPWCSHHKRRAFAS